MAAKVELETYVMDTHPHPQYLQHHISCCNTSAKLPVIEGDQLVSDGFPQDMDKKEFSSTNVKFVNGHTETTVKTVEDPHVMLGIVF